MTQIRPVYAFLSIEYDFNIENIKNSHFWGFFWKMKKWKWKNENEKWKKSSKMTIFDIFDVKIVFYGQKYVYWSNLSHIEYLLVNISKICSDTIWHAIITRVRLIIACKNMWANTLFYFKMTTFLFYSHYLSEFSSVLLKKIFRKINLSSSIIM